MKQTLGTAFIALACVALTSCASISLVKPGTVEIENTYTVETNTAWNRMSGQVDDLWTLDGPLVQAIYFYTGIEEGENIFQNPGSDNGPDAKYKNMPKFKKGMTAFDISEMVVATLAQSKASDIQVVSLTKAEFGNRDGFRFELRYKDAESLERKALVFGTAQNDRLHLILYQAPAIYYFDRDKARVEQIFKSVRFLDRSA